MKPLPLVIDSTSSPSLLTRDKGVWLKVSTLPPQGWFSWKSAPNRRGGSKSHLINIKKTPLSLSLLRKTQGALCQKWGIYCKSHEETDSSSYLMRGVPASLRRALEMEYVVVADCHKSALRSQKLTSFPNAEYTHSLLKIPSLTLLVASACI